MPLFGSTSSGPGISRDAFLDRMTRLGIGVGVHYLSIPEHPYYQQTLGWKPEDYPHAMRAGRQNRQCADFGEAEYFGLLRRC